MILKKNTKKVLELARTRKLTTKTSEIVLHILNNILFIEVFVITFETKYVWIRIFFLNVLDISRTVMKCLLRFEITKSTI